MPPTTNLDSVADRIRTWCESMRVPDAPYGAYRFSETQGPGFYATADMAIIRWAIGDDLEKTVDEEDRADWAEVINSYQSSFDGRYGPEMRHHVLHANGTAANALKILGHRNRHPVHFYELFNTPERIGPWLSQINWTNQWSASHLVWGGPVVWASSAEASTEWRVACYRWLDEQLDEYGSWPKDFGGDQREIAPLGCAVHIWPLYRHYDSDVPGLERLADWTLHWQQPDGHWDGVGRYGTMDALYVLSVAIEKNLPKAESYRNALERYLQPHFALLDQSWSTLDAHYILGWTSCIGYLQRALPQAFTGDIRWGDIFDLPEIYDLDAVTAVVEPEPVRRPVGGSSDPKA